MAQINSIYNIPDWESDKTWNKFDPAAVSGYVRYSTLNHTVTAGGSFSGELWNGLKLINGIWTAYFPENIKPSYPVNVNQQPRVRTVQFGDGYSVRYSDSLNPNLLTLDLEFNGRSYQEALAISHFLHNQEGRHAFLFIPPAPFATEKYFICPEWSPIINFHSNYSIRAKFQEVPA